MIWNKLKNIGLVLPAGMVMTCAAVSLTGKEPPDYISLIPEISATEMLAASGMEGVAGTASLKDTVAGAGLTTAGGMADSAGAEVMGTEALIGAGEIAGSSETGNSTAMASGSATAGITTGENQQTAHSESGNGSDTKAAGVAGTSGNRRSVGLPQAESSDTGYLDGTYRGTGDGFGGEMTVEVKVKDGRITSVRVLEHQETPAFLQSAMSLCGQIVSSQGTKVDTVSGATYSSKGIIGGARNALAKAVSGKRKEDSSTGVSKANSMRRSEEKPADSSTNQTTGNSGTESKNKTSDGNRKEKSSDGKNNKNNSGGKTNEKTSGGKTKEKISGGESKEKSSGTDDPKGNGSKRKDTDSGEKLVYKNGTYSGTGTGFSGKLKASVVVKKGKIESIEVVESSDDEVFLNRARQIIPEIIRNQNTEVDVISGATYSSGGILEAVEHALEKAYSTSSDHEEQTGETKNAGTRNTKNGGAKDTQSAGTKSNQNDAKKDTKNGGAGNNQNDAKKDTKNGGANSNKNGTETGIQSEGGTTKDTQKEGSKTKETKKDGKKNSENAENGRENTGNSESGTESPEEKETVPSVEKYLFADGTYKGTAVCTPDESEDFWEYCIDLEIIVKEDAIKEIRGVKGYGDNYLVSNTFFINTSLNGSGKKPGLTEQLLGLGRLEGVNALNRVDLVSGATCSSCAILDACRDALEKGWIK